MEKTKLHPINISIKNFQSIEELDFEIRGFTCITGKSNIGKSAIIRAVAASLRNAPVVGMVRKDAKFCEIKFKTEGLSFSWEKGDKKSGKYRLNGTDYEKVGQVQLEKMKELGYGSVKVGSKEVYPWHATQFDPIFLLNDSGPAVTEFISEISRLNTLQDAITISLRRKKRFLDRIKLKKEDLGNLYEKLNELDRLDEMIQVSVELEEQAESIRLYEEKITIGGRLLDKMKEQTDKIKLLQEIEKLKIPKNAAKKTYTKLAEVVKQFKILQAHALGIIKIKKGEEVEVPKIPEKEFDNYSKLLKLQESLILKELVDNLSRAEKINPPKKIGGDIEKLGRMIELEGVLEQLVKDIEELSGEESDIENIRITLQKDLEGIPTCPTCTRPVDGSKIHTHSA